VACGGMRCVAVKGSRMVLVVLENDLVAITFLYYVSME
jgi:hypothetical protein